MHDRLAGGPEDGMDELDQKLLTLLYVLKAVEAKKSQAA